MNLEVRPRVPQHASTMPSRLRNFTRMKPPILFGSKADEYSQYFLDEVYKILITMGVTSNEKVVLVAYQLQDVVQTWYTQWRYNRVLRGGPLTCEIIKRTFLYRFFPREFREAKVEESINLH